VPGLQNEKRGEEMGPRKSGFRRIENDLFKALMAAQLTGAGYQVVLTVIDKTIGFHKEEAKITLKCFQEAAGLSRQSVLKAIKQAEERKIVSVKRNGTRPSVYALNPNEQWLARQRNHPSKLGNEINPNWATKSPQTRQPTKPRTTRTKYTLKETLKDNVPKDNRVLNNNSLEKDLPPPTPSLIRKKNGNEEPTASRTPIHANTYREQIVAYLRDNGLAAIKAIARGTGICPNSVNVALHNGKGKVFYHDSEKRAWGLLEETLALNENILFPLK
jgi:phage replication O-like protein O